MKKVGMNLSSALQLVKNRRDCAEPIPAFIEQLRRYEDECKSLGLIKDANGGGSQSLTRDKKVYGPTMTTIGPAMPKDDKLSRAPIGPAMPKDDKPSRASIGPSMPKHTRTDREPIGPSLPSQTASPKKRDIIDCVQSEDDTVVKVKKSRKLNE
mmetsp:Transcript_28059/g.34644  ORF Transcript_28059/g.34644 Transcript_28059/m.34644 type:complete len:154 (-) Transcript_28059:195-656(-)